MAIFHTFANFDNIDKMTEVRFYKPDYEPGAVFTYSVISARIGEKWIFVRHHKRDTWEIAGGHIEAGETPDEAAERELKEETGAIHFSLRCIATYSVTIDGITGWGRLYYAEVEDIGPIPDISEIAEVTFSDHFIGKNTYPEIQPLLWQKTLEYLKGSGLRAKGME